MPFPISISGTLSRPKSREISELKASIANALNDEYATTVSIENDTIIFKAGIFRVVSNWNVLVPIGAGSIRIDDSEIEYHLDTTEMFYVTTFVMLVILGTFVYISGITLFAMLVMPIGWLWLNGGNYILTLMRFPAFLERAIENSKSSIVQ